MDSQQQESFSEVLRRYSIHVGIKAEELAACVHVSRRTVSSWMNGAVPTLSHLQELTSCLMLTDGEIETMLEAAGYPKGLYAQLAEGQPPPKQGFRRGSSEPRNPYKGLQPFTQEDVGDFFGREQLIQEWVQALEKSLLAPQAAEQNERFLAIVGASGTGKTSAVQAGLLPALQQGAIAISDTWVFLEPLLEPEKPMQALSSVLAKQLPTLDQEHILHLLEQAPDSLVHFTRSLGTLPETIVFVIVDQCEKLFTDLVNEQERKHFIDLLVTASTMPGSNVCVLLILRADFYGQPMVYPPLAKLIRSHQVGIASMDRRALREVIERPAALPGVGLRFEHYLVDLLLQQVEVLENPLPLLQFILDQLYQHRVGRRITIQTLNEIRDTPEVLTVYAKYAPMLPNDERARKYFLRGMGFSDTAIEYLLSILAPTPIQYYSLFIAYANPDEALAKRLYDDLQSKGVRCWMAPHDLRPGDYHHSRIDEAIRLHEKVLLLLSEHAVNSSWVKHEVQIAEAREIKLDRTILFPLRLDQAVMQTSKDWAVRLRENRHIGDFTKWQDDAAYQQAFTTLLQHLKVTKSPTP